MNGHPSSSCSLPWTSSGNGVCPGDVRNNGRAEAIDMIMVINARLVMLKPIVGKELCSAIQSMGIAAGKLVRVMMGCWETVRLVLLVSARRTW